MGKLRIDPSNPNTFARLLKEGRSQGEGEKYIPWLTIQDLSSRGVSSRLQGWRTGNRLLHLFSKLERDFFYTIEWDPTVVDYHEQFLLDPQVTMEIAQQAGLKHPTSPKTGRLFPMTTDLLIKKIINEETKYSARAVKPFVEVGPNASPRKAKRLADKLWIEREYWRTNHINGITVDWALVTEKDFDPVLAKNLRAIHDYYHPRSLSPLSEAKTEEVHQELFPKVERQEQALSRLSGECDRKLGLPTGKSLTVAYHFIATRRWPADLTVPFETLKPLRLLQ